VPEPQDQSDSALDRLWKEYGKSFRAFDDLTLARWCSQTLGQLHGQSWRMSHPLVGAYRLAAQVANERGIWHQRLVNMPVGYIPAECCRAPLLPLLTREVGEFGLLCLHCNEPAIPPEQIPADVMARITKWTTEYAEFHEVAHWDEKRRAKSDYDAKYEEAAENIERLLADAAEKIVPLLLEHYPAVLWEDQDECLEVRPEDIPV